jgi:hypothetical protein
MTKLARLAGLTAAIVLVSTAVQAATPVKVMDSAADEFSSAAGGAYLAWSSNGSPGKLDYDLYVKEKGVGTRIRDAGHAQDVGNIEIGGPHGDILVYALYPPRGGDGDIKFYDLADGTQSNPPAGINTAKDDESPAISGEHLLFGRGPANKGGFTSKQVILYDFTAHTFTTIATAPLGNSVTANGLRGDFATYDQCPSSGKCNVFRYQISTHTKIKMPNPGRATYWSSVLEDGTVYFVQGAPTSCGLKTRIMRWRNGTLTRLVQLPNGYEIADLDAFASPTGPVVFFTRINCQKGFVGGIWKIKG